MRVARKSPTRGCLLVDGGASPGWWDCGSSPRVGDIVVRPPQFRRGYAELPRQSADLCPAYHAHSSRPGSRSSPARRSRWSTRRHLGRDADVVLGQRERRSGRRGRPRRGAEAARSQDSGWGGTSAQHAICHPFPPGFRVHLRSIRGACWPAVPPSARPGGQMALGESFNPPLRALRPPPDLRGGVTSARLGLLSGWIDGGGFRSTRGSAATPGRNSAHRKLEGLEPKAPGRLVLRVAD
jgi:hypothetical protein